MWKPVILCEREGIIYWCKHYLPELKILNWSDINNRNKNIITHVQVATVTPNLEVLARMHLEHYSDVIISAMAFEIIGVSIVCSTVYLGEFQRKHHSSVSLAFVRVVHRWLVDSPHKGPIMRKIFPVDDVIMKEWIKNTWMNTSTTRLINIIHARVIEYFPFSIVRYNF